jgi:chromosome partitioning protein
MVDRSAFKVPFRLGGTIYDLTEKEAANPQAAIDNAEEFAQEVRDVLFGKKTEQGAETEVSANVG